MKKVRLYDLAQVIRSKNSGPFQTTLDVIFYLVSYKDVTQEK